MGVIVRQGFKAAISNYIGMVLGFVSLFILFPLFYPTKELGAIRIFLELATVLSAFALMGTHYSVNRFFPFFKTSDQKHHGFFFWVLIFPLIGFLLLLLSLLLFGQEFLHIHQSKSQWICGFIPAVIVVDFYHSLPKCHRGVLCQSWQNCSAQLHERSGNEGSYTYLGFVVLL